MIQLDDESIMIYPEDAETYYELDMKLIRQHMCFDEIQFWFHARMWNYKSYFYFEAVTIEKSCKKEKFVIWISRFQESFCSKA